MAHRVGRKAGKWTTLSRVTREAEVAPGLEAGTAPEQRDSGQGGILVGNRKPEGPASDLSSPGLLPEGPLIPQLVAHLSGLQWPLPPPLLPLPHTGLFTLNLPFPLPCLCPAPSPFPVLLEERGRLSVGCWGTEPAARAVSANQGEGYLCLPEVDGSGGSGCGLH